jgi:UDP-glucose 4-epimerase
MSLAGTRCLVLGAGGFIGANLTRALLASGAVVTGMGRAPRFAAPSHAWIERAIEDAAALRDAIAAADYVFHLIGSADPGASNRDPIAEIRTSVPASLAVLEACRDSDVRRLVFLSSGGTIYRPGLSMPIAETAPTDPISAYGIGKLTIEKYGDLYRRLYGLDMVTLRVSNPYGPFQDPGRTQGFIAKAIKRALAGEPIEIWGDGSAVRDYLFVEDLSAAIIAAAERPVTDSIFNIGSGEGRSLRAVLADVRRITKRDLQVRYLPARSADVPANILSIDRARDQLGWQPTTVWTDGLVRTRDWIAAQL